MSQPQSPRLPRLPKCLKLTSQLSPEDVSQAWAYLVSLPESSPLSPNPEEPPLPPQNLQHLTGGDWFLLSNLLLQELHQRELQPLH